MSDEQVSIDEYMDRLKSHKGTWKVIHINPLGMVEWSQDETGKYHFRVDGLPVVSKTRYESLLSVMKVSEKYRKELAK
jgi:hypothetical protein